MPTIAVFLPNNSQVLLKEGDAVTYGGELAHSSSASHVTFNIVSLLGIKSNQLSSVLKAQTGMHVKKGDVLAKKSQALGLTSKVIRATIGGKVIRIDEAKGEIEIAPDNTQEATITSPVNGTIKKIEEAEITIDFKGTILFTKRGMGSLVKGTLVVLGEAEEVVTIGQITNTHVEQIILGGRFSRQVLEKAFGMGVLAVIGTDIEDGDFAYFEESKLFFPSISQIAKADFKQVAALAEKEVVVEGQHKRILAQN